MHSCIVKKAELECFKCITFLWQKHRSKIQFRHKSFELFEGNILQETGVLIKCDLASRELLKLQGRQEIHKNKRKLLTQKYIVNVRQYCGRHWGNLCVFG